MLVRILLIRIELLCGLAEELYMSHGSAIDHAAFQSLRARENASNSELLNTLIDHFLNETNEHLRRLELALHQGDALGLVNVARNLHTLCNEIGAVPMAHLTQDLEQLGRGGTLDSYAAALYYEILQEFSRVAVELELCRTA